MTGDDEQRYLVPGLMRGMLILQMFRAGRDVIAPPEMAAELGIPRSTVFRLVQTLEHLNLLERVDHGQAYRLGLGVLRLGFELLAGLDITALGRPILDRLSRETGLSSHLVLRDGIDVVVVYKAEGRSAFSGALTIGARLPVHGTVLGRMTLIDMDHAALTSLFGPGPLNAYTPQTPTRLEDLEALLAQDRENGYAVSDSFFESGISAVAAPVRDGTGKAIGALNVTLTGGSQDGTPRLEPVIDQVVAAANQLSQSLDYRPGSPNPQQGGRLVNAG